MKSDAMQEVIALLEERVAEAMTPTLTDRICRVMADVGQIGFDAQNPHARYKYVSVDKMYDRLRPIMARHGVRPCHVVTEPVMLPFCTTEFPFQPVTMWLTDGKETTTPTIWHVPLQAVRTHKGIVYTPQTLGAVVSYAMKYFLRAEFLIATGDDDLDAHAQPPAIVPDPEPAQKKTRKRRAPDPVQQPEPPAPEQNEAPPPDEDPVRVPDPVEAERLAPTLQDDRIVSASGKPLKQYLEEQGTHGKRELYRVLRDLLQADKDQAWLQGVIDAHIEEIQQLPANGVKRLAPLAAKAQVSIA